MIEFPSSLSPSQLSVWLTCQRQWHFGYRMNLADRRPKAIYLDKGNYIHELMHLYYALLKAGYIPGDPIVIDTITTRIKEDLEELGEIDWEFYNEVVRVIVRYIKERSHVIDFDIKEFHGIEEELVYWHDGRKFHGFLDLRFIRKGDKVPTIRDHKSGAQNRFQYGRQNMDMQMLFYTTLYWKLTGIVPKAEINWVHSKPPKKPGRTQVWDLIPIVFTESQCSRFWDYLVEEHEKQKNPQTSQNLSHCKNCRFNTLCLMETRGVNTDFLIGTKYVERTPKPEPEERKVPLQDTPIPGKDQPSGGPNLEWNFGSD